MAGVLEESAEVDCEEDVGDAMDGGTGEEEFLDRSLSVAESFRTDRGLPESLDRADI